MSTQYGILAAGRAIAKMEAGQRQEAEAALAYFRKTDQLLRERLFILQVWRKHGEVIARQLASMKAGELLDPDLAKLLKDKLKSEQKIQRDLAKDRVASQQQAKRFKPYHGAGTSGYNRGSQNRGGHSRGGRGYARGGSSNGRGAEPEPGSVPKERSCYLCHSTEHFIRNCPKNIK